MPSSASHQVEDDALDDLCRLLIEAWEPKKHDFPWRKPDAEWKLLVTEILLQRTHANAVKAVYASFFERFSSPRKLANADESDVVEAMFSLGLPKRAAYIQSLAEELVQRGGGVPQSTAELKTFKGIGPYVAGAFQVLQRNKPGWFADANVARFLCRYFDFRRTRETPRRKWFQTFVGRLFDHDYPPQTFGYALLDFTRTTCVQQPTCATCPTRCDCCLFASDQL